MPSKPLADFVCCNSGSRCNIYCDFILTVKTSAAYVLRRYGTDSDFTCVNYLDWGFNVATKIIVNILTTNRLSRDIVRKESFTEFKKRQRTKQTIFKSLSFFTKVPNVNYSDRMVLIKYRQNPLKIL